ncbi:MAG: flippase [Eggerthellaceae bacterium]
MGNFKIRSIKYNFFMNLLLTGSSVFFPLVTFPLVSRALYSDMYGLCNWAASVVSWLSLIAMLGVNRYGIREVARNRDNEERLVKVTVEILVFTLCTTAIVYLCFAVSLFVVDDFAENRTLFLINSVTILCNTLGVGWFFQGIEQYTYITVRGVAIKIASFASIALLVHAPDDYLIYAAVTVLASGIANLVNFVYMTYTLKRVAISCLNKKNSTHHFFSAVRLCAKKAGGFAIKPHIRPMLSFFIIAASISIYTILDTVMLGFLSTNQQVGYYSAAINIKAAIAGVVSALAGVLLPRASYMLANKNKQEYLSIIKKCTYFIICSSVPLSVVLALMATPLLSWYAGADFAGAGPVLSIVALSIIPVGLSGVFCDSVMIPLGLERYCVKIYIFAAVTNFAMNLFFIPILGAVGAAISTLTVEIIIALTEFMIVRGYIWGTKLRLE